MAGDHIFYWNAIARRFVEKMVSLRFEVFNR